MAKIQTYSLATTPLSLDDMLIGTDIINPIPNATKNFSLGQLLSLFLPYIPSNTLQAVLNAGNTATQNITLTGTITATVIKPTNITDTNSSNGNTGQVLSKQAAGIVWTTINGLPFQPGNNGRFLTTNGSIATWAVLTGLPSQAGFSGRYLTTDGTNASWSVIPSPATTSNVTADLTVGAINAGDVVASGTTLQGFVEKLITKVYNPSYVSPSFSLTSNASTVEVGTTVSFTLYFNFYRGAIYGSTSGVWNPNYFQNDRAGAATSYTINGFTQAGSSLLISGYIVLLGTNLFDATVDYAIGPQPYNSKGLTTGLTPLAAGTSPNQSTSFQGIYPYYYYKSSSPITAASMQTAIESGLATKVVGFSTGTLYIPYNVNQEYMSVAYPDASPQKTQYFVSIFDSGSLGTPTSPFDLGTVLNCSADNTLTPIWSNIPYRIHVSPILTNSATTIELRN